ncbi:MAG: glycosyltransferase family 9 protein [Oligoflexia bacterium]|nr:glycosyltransferase family 9 protein [Oligoflexia bacterium]
MPPRKILAIKLRALGDTILLTAPLSELQRAYPDAEIHVAVTSRWAPLLEGHPAIHRIWPYDRHTERSARAKAVAALALKLRKENFDCAVNFHASPSSATLAYATGAKIRSVHFHGHKDKNRFSTVTVPGKGELKPAIERDMDALRALGLQIPPGRLPKIHLSSEELQQAGKWLRKAGLHEPILALGLSASRPTKSWPPDRFASLAINWCRTENGSVFVATGADDDAALNAFLDAVDDRIVAYIPNRDQRAEVRTRIVVERELPLRRLAAILSHAAVFAGNDSGPKHLAVAAGIPTVTLFGPEHPAEWHPYPTDRHPYFFLEDLRCRRDAMPGMPPWCGLPVCKDEHHRCMREIGVDAVLSACRQAASQPR